jgi:hypothetical protein
MRSYTPGTYKMPEPKRKITRRGGLKVSLEMLRDGQCKFVSSESLRTSKERQNAAASMHTTANAMGIRITTYTSVDNRIVAQLKEGAA